MSTAQAFNKQVAFIVGWLIIFSGVVGTATVALGFAGYFHALVEAPIFPSALVLVLLLSAILFIGIEQSARMAMAFTLIEAFGLILIIVAGFPYYGSVDYLEMPLGFSGIFQGAALIFFAYLGFEEIVKLAEETKEPERTIPIGLMLAVSASIILYIFVAFSAVSILGWQPLSQSSAPLADIASAALGKNAFIVLSIIALFATSNTVLLMLLAASRITYGMAESSLPRILSKIHLRTRTPWMAILGTTVMTIVFILLNDIGYLAGITDFTVFITFVVINGSLIVLRYKQADVYRPFQVPIALGRFPLPPLLGLFFNIFMLIQLSVTVLALGTLLVIVGILVSLMLKGNMDT